MRSTPPSCGWRGSPSGRAESASPRVFVSVTHSWARPNSRSETKNLAGKHLLEGLTAASRAGGDFGWEVAHHPYPQNLFEPRFWNDSLAMFGFDTPQITFKNVEVLPAWLRRPENLVDGQPRGVILSEQGFHTPEGGDGEEVQAAAYALAHHRIERIGGIDAFILHRHVDVRGEGGLLLGVRHLAPRDGSKPYGERKRSWFTFASRPHAGLPLGEPLRPRPRRLHRLVRSRSPAGPVPRAGPRVGGLRQARRRSLRPARARRPGPLSPHA